MPMLWELIRGTIAAREKWARVHQTMAFMQIKWNMQADLRKLDIEKGVLRNIKVYNEMKLNI